MNLVKASTILYPILGENVSDIVLIYMECNDMEIKIDKPNMYKFFTENDLRLNRLDIVYEMLQRCSRKCIILYTINSKCNKHNECMNLFKYYVFAICKIPIAIFDNANSIESVVDIIHKSNLFKYLFEAYLKDSESNDLTSKIEIIKSNSYDDKRSFC